MNNINELEKSIKKIEESEKIIFPSELKNIYLELNGFLGKSYISIFKIDELLEFNHLYAVELIFPGFFIFASDGGGESFGFIKNREFEIQMVPFIGMCKEDAVPIAKTKNEFFDKITQGLLYE